MAANETRERLLDAAERLFAEHGFAGTSLRTVTAAAGVNLAAVHYHFGTKDALLNEVFARRIGPVNRERLARLDALEAAAAGAPLAVEAILETLLGPMLRQGSDQPAGGEVWRRLVGRAHSEPLDVIAALIEQHFAEIDRRFSAALARALPGLMAEEIAARLQFMVGAMTHVLSGLYGLKVRADDDTTLACMVGTFAAGFRAPPCVSAAPQRRRRA